MAQYNLQLTKSIQEIIKKHIAFDKTVEKLQELMREISADYEMKIKSKQDQLNSLETEYKNTEKLRKLEVDLSIKEHGYIEAKRILAARNEIPVNEEELKNLRQENVDLKASRDAEIKKVLAEEKERYKRHTTQLEKTLQLQKTAEIAQKEAELKTQTNEIELLKDTIQGLKSDLNAQRVLTKDVAMASANSKQVLVTPSGRS